MTYYCTETKTCTPQSICTEYSGPSLKGHSLDRTPLYNGHTFLAASTVMLALTKGHNSNKDRIFLAEEVPLLEGDYCT